MNSSEKKEIRRRVRADLAAMSVEARTGASEEIAMRLFQVESWKQAKVIMAYMSMPTEPDTGEILREARRAGKTILLPRCGKAPEMEALPWRGEKWMQPGSYGILEPVPDEGADFAEIPEPDLILVPCVAVTREGIRLGHGAGYYDWFLNRHPVETVCLCFRQQLMDSLPAESWDIQMDSVIWA